MAYLIDGHNLIGQLRDLSLTDPDDEAKLVQKLLGLAARQGKRIVVVFDSGLPGGKSRLSTHQVEVVFATARSSADDVLKARIQQTRDPGQWIVVSNDHAVRDAARARRMTTLTSAEFAPLLQPTPAPRPGRAASPAADAEADAGAASDVRLSPEEVEAWLKLFRDGK